MTHSHNPFPGPQPYTSADRGAYFGRDEALVEVCEAVVSHRTLTVFGPSGAGKSSLLQAGVVPALRDEWRLRTVNVDAWPPDGIEELGPLGRLVEVFGEDLGLGHIEVHEGDDVGATLDKALKLAFKRSPRKVLVVLDQLEQLLVHHPREVLDQFVDVLAHLHRYRGNGLHVVLSLREDYLGRWNDLFQLHPEVVQQGYRLPRLSVDEITAAMVSAAATGAPPQTWDPAQLTPLVQTMAIEGQWRSDRVEVESAFVQIVCRALFERGGPASHGAVNPREILEDYLGSTLAGLGELEDAAWKLLETRLITEDGSRVPINQAVAVAVVGGELGAERILDVLAGARILRARSLHGVTFYELGHDWLATPIQKRAEDRREAAVRAEAASVRRRQVRVVGLVIVGLLGMLGLSQWHNLELKAQKAKLAAAEQELEETLDKTRKATVNQLNQRCKKDKLIAELDPVNHPDPWNGVACDLIYAPIPEDAE